MAQTNVADDIWRTQFNQMQHLLSSLKTIFPQADTLSMGMSSDMNIAIECVATMVRIGSAILANETMLPETIQSHYLPIDR